MSDSLKNDLVDVNFVGGEQPGYSKLTSMMAQLDTAISRLSKAVGDIYSDQTFTGSSGSYQLDELLTVGPNLNRQVGSAGWMNPRHFSRESLTRTVVLVGHQAEGVGTPPVLGGYPHYNRREFRLPWPPLTYTSFEGDESPTLLQSSVTITAPGGTFDDGQSVAANQKTYKKDVDSTGDFHVSADGIVTLFDALDDNFGFSITYTANPMADSYDGASQNVIPDFSQTTTLCDVTLVSGTTYNIELPVFENKREGASLGRPDLLQTYYSVTVSKEHMEGLQLNLPVALRDSLSFGDVIPEGYLYLWDDTNSVAIGGLTFTYVDEYNIQSTGVSLTTGSTKYRVITAGCTIGETLATLRESYYYHDHSGRIVSGSSLNMGERIHHYDTLNLVDEGDDNREGFVVSELGPTMNPHPQYLHRDGYRYQNTVDDGTSSTGNRHNALLGDLVIANTSEDLNVTTDSHTITFGAPLDGPFMYYQQNVGSDGALRAGCINYAVPFWSTWGVSAGNNGGESAIKWVKFTGTFPSSGNAYGIAWTKPSDFNNMLGVTIVARNDADTSFFHIASALNGLTPTGTSYVTVDNIQLVTTTTFTATVAFGDAIRSDTYDGIMFYI